MRMPKIGGADACAAIRTVSDLPIIMFTSTNDAATVKDAIEKGATDFVLKSSGMASLTERVAFHLSKPVDEPVPLETATASAKAHEKVRKPLKTTTLIVDPDEKSRSLIKSVLTRLNQNVVEVSTAAEAIIAFQEHRPNIIITEYSLPDMAAFKMLTEFKPPQRAKQVLKLMMSARLTPEAHRKAQFVGFSNFLNKPLNDSKVEMMVADCIRSAMRKLRARSAKSKAA